MIETVNMDELYSTADAAVKRYDILKKMSIEKFGHDAKMYFSSAGRTEIIGNHTDHNGGRVIAAAIDLDTIAAAADNGTDVINIASEGHNFFSVKTDGHIVSQGSESSSSALLTRGIIEAFVKKGYNVSGFDACITSSVIAGAGLSSSASYEMLICAIINYMFNDNRIDLVQCAKFGQYAENVYWEKSSGLMDQIACAAGGAVLLDFSDINDVRYEKLDVDFRRFGYELVIVNTGGGHADLSADYSAIVSEMKAAANALGKQRLCEADMETLLACADSIGNDREVLRAMHYYDECRRVEDMAQAVKENDSSRALALIDQSGRSSYELLQNCYCSSNHAEQKIPLALALSRRYFETNDIPGVCRVHGGGFAGAIVSVVPVSGVHGYMDYMERYFGAGNVFNIAVRKHGTVRVDVG